MPIVKKQCTRCKNNYSEKYFLSRKGKVLKYCQNCRSIMNNANRKYKQKIRDQVFDQLIQIKKAIDADQVTDDVDVSTDDIDVSTNDVDDSTNDVDDSTDIEDINSIDATESDDLNNNNKIVMTPLISKLFDLYDNKQISRDQLLELLVL